MGLSRQREDGRPWSPKSAKSWRGVEKFLPGPLSPEKLRPLVKPALSDQGALELKDLGKAMAALKDQSLGRADGKAVSAESAF